MLIDFDVLHFCAEKTREVAQEHDQACGLGVDCIPRSAEDLHLILMGKHGFPIYHKELKISWEKAKFRSFYIPKGEGPYIKECSIYYAAGMSVAQLRYYKTKELLQIHLWQEATATRDVVELVQNMILRGSPAAMDLNLGHSTTSDTIGELAAMEFLFPTERRIAYLKQQKEAPGKNGVEKLAEDYKIPAFIVGRALRLTDELKDFFCPGTP